MSECVKGHACYSVVLFHIGQCLRHSINLIITIEDRLMFIELWVQLWLLPQIQEIKQAVIVNITTITSKWRVAPTAETALLLY
jgi:hypothetical protein